MLHFQNAVTQETLQKLCSSSEVKDVSLARIYIKKNNGKVALSRPVFSLIFKDFQLFISYLFPVFSLFLVSRQSSVVMDTHSIVTPVRYVVIITV